MFIDEGVVYYVVADVNAVVERCVPSARNRVRYIAFLIREHLESLKVFK